MGPNHSSYWFFRSLWDIERRRARYATQSSQASKHPWKLWGLEDLAYCFGVEHYPHSRLFEYLFGCLSGPLGQ